MPKWLLEIQGDGVTDRTDNAAGRDLDAEEIERNLQAKLNQIMADGHVNVRVTKFLQGEDQIRAGRV